MTLEVSVVWFRRDLRLADNPALTAAARRGAVVPLFVLDDRLLVPAGPNRVAFLFGCLRDLDEQLDGALVVRAGRPADVVPAVADDAGARTVSCAADFGPYGRERDAGVEAALRARGIAFESVGSAYAVPPGSVATGAGSPFKVFSPFYRAWRGHGWGSPVTAPRLDDDILCAARSLRSDPIPDDPVGTAPELPSPGEGAATDRLAMALEGADRYGGVRNAPGVDATTRLSPYLKYGCVHPRQVLAELGDDPSHERLRKELAWREFYADVLWHEPSSCREPLRADVGAIEVDEGPDADAKFEAWATGRTGFPIVDAGMRQLLAEGWMHNRVRMITASFLVKDLHIDWRRGAHHFMHHLVDGDLASNAHGWQWVAGTGTDPAPYFRIFNPVLQGEKFDPQGDYVRRYVPELRESDDRFVHHPWDAPASLFSTYPAPIVDHAAERAEALRRYADVKR